VVGFRSGPSAQHDARILLVAEFTAGEVADVRRQVEDLGRRCGLGRQESSDWVTAVNELMTNAVRHGGGAGRLRLWRNGRLYCEVSDDGGGFAVAPYLGRAARPAPSAAGGMGLWIVQQMTDALSISSGPAGTVARVSVEAQTAS
jgi:anti-sigma regulatory factor (Ser/Thr protein kinase)